MNKMKRFWTIVGMGALVVSFALCDVALAGRVTGRQIRQQKRIDQGIASGELTRWEVRRLEREQARIQRVKQEAWSDGYLSPGEKATLKVMQDKASMHIYQLKHNDFDR